MEESASDSILTDVGTILFDQAIDDSSFALCDSSRIFSGRNAIMFGDTKEAIEQECMKNFEFEPEFESFSGFVVVRFVVNCNAETGRFRAQTLDFDFSKKECPPELVSHLLGIVKGLKNWNQTRFATEGSDYSKYINFKIINGKIETVLR